MCPRLLERPVRKSVSLAFPPFNASNASNSLRSCGSCSLFNAGGVSTIPPVSQSSPLRVAKSSYSSAHNYPLSYELLLRFYSTQSTQSTQSAQATGNSPGDAIPTKVSNTELQRMESHFKVALLQNAIRELPAKVSYDKFIDFCVEFLYPEKEKTNHIQEVEQILSTFHDAGLVYWSKETGAVWIETTLMRSRILERIFEQDIGDAIILNNENNYKEYTSLKEELLPLHERYLRLHAVARYQTENWIYFGAGALTFQGLIMAHMTWNLYGWDVIEPVTYFSGFTIALGSFMFFTLWKKDYDYKTAKSLIRDATMNRIIKKNNFPIERYAQLLGRWDAMSHKFKSEGKFLYGKSSPKLDDLVDLGVLIKQKVEKEREEN